jgi:hypothetical protein
MSPTPIQTGLRHLGLWVLIAGFVALLTLIFSFVGAFFCAALGGMAMGATKVSKGLSVPFSTLCPAVLVAVMRTQKNELKGNQVMLLVVLCFTVFWVIYFLAALLAAYEKQNRSEAAPGSMATHAVSPGSVAGSDLSSPPAVGAAIVAPGLRLEELEGEWRCEICGLDGRTQKRVLEIHNGALVLRVLDAEGRVCSCGQGRLQLLTFPKAAAG